MYLNKESSKYCVMQVCHFSISHVFWVMLWILCNIYKNTKRVLSDLKLQWICPITLMSYVYRMLSNKKDRIHVIVFFNCRYNVWVFHGELQHMKYIMSQISALQVSCDRPSQGFFFSVSVSLAVLVITIYQRGMLKIMCVLEYLFSAYRKVMRHLNE